MRTRRATGGGDGGKGAALAFDGKIFWRIVTPRIHVVNPIGSGDAFTAGLVWRLVRGDDLGEACRWGAPPARPMRSR